VRVNPSLLLLALVWVALLLPGAVRSTLRSSPRTTVGGFRRAMDGLRDGTRGAAGHPVGAVHGAGRSGRAPVSASTSAAAAPLRATRPEDPAVVRRRTRFLRLVAATLLALVAAPLVGGALAWTVAAVLVTATSASVVVLRRLTVQRAAARRTVVALDLRRPAPPLHDEVTGELLLAAGSAGNVVRLRSWSR